MKVIVWGYSAELSVCFLESFRERIQDNEDIEIRFNEDSSRRIRGDNQRGKPYHRGEGARGGQFTSKKKAKVYSLSNRAKGKTNHEAPLRGKVTSGGKVSSPIGMNTSKPCGRTEFPSGREKHSGISCSQYSARYDEAFQALEEIAEQLGTLQEGPECDACLRNFIAKLRQSNLAIKSALDPKIQKEHETYGGEKVSPGDRKTPSRRSSERRKKFKTMAGMNFDKSGFSKSERSLLNPNSLFEQC
jgi:hypothetical protein